MIEMSVIIPIYKPNFTFAECIDSISKQSLNMNIFNVICILNGIKADYEDYVLGVLKKSKLNYKYFYTELANVSNARNIGLDNADGDYITFIDSDDKISEHYLSNLLQIAQNNYLGISNVICFDDDVQYNDYLSVCYMKGKLRNKNNHLNMRSFFSTPCCKIIKKSDITNNRFNLNYSYGEDALFMFSIEKNLPKTIILADDAVYYRRITKDSLSRSNKKSEVRRIYTKMLYEYSKIYFKSFYKYNLFFFLSRVVACFIHIFKGK